MKVALIHPFDPRGNKVGGLETYTRDFIRFHPDDMDLMMIGVDGRGDLKLGEVVNLELFGRSFKFMPILHYSDNDIHQAASSIFKSITFGFALAILKNFLKISRILRGGYSVDLRRSEFSWFCVINKIPFIQMLHGEGAPKLKMDSLLGKYRFVHNLNEAFAMHFCEKFLCVNPFITERIKEKYPRHFKKIDTLTTWYNPDVYKPTNISDLNNVLKIVYCGRLDLFKVPSLMFSAIDAYQKRSKNKRVEFHYIGTSDPSRFPEFEAIKNCTIIHGFKTPAEIAEILKLVHCGILTSEFEGMPRCVLETLGAGRPVVAVNLPQLEDVIEDGVSGYLVPRASFDEMRENLVTSLIQVENDILNQRIRPGSVADKVRNYTPKILLGRVYEFHRIIGGFFPSFYKK